MIRRLTIILSNWDSSCVVSGFCNIESVKKRRNNNLLIHSQRDVSLNGYVWLLVFRGNVVFLFISFYVVRIVFFQTTFLVILGKCKIKLKRQKLFIPLKKKIYHHHFGKANKNFIDPKNVLNVNCSNIYYIILYRERYMGKTIWAVCSCSATLLNFLFIFICFCSPSPCKQQLLSSV